MEYYNIYFYAQSLDNISQDDIYQAIIAEKDVKKIENPLDRQKVPQLISKIFSSNVSYEEDPKFKIYLHNIEKNTEKFHILIKFDTNQKDDLGRSSINHLILENVNFNLGSALTRLVQDYDLETYINDFLKQTNRGEFEGEYNWNSILAKMSGKKKQITKVLWAVLGLGLIISVIFSLKSK